MGKISFSDNGDSMTGSGAEPGQANRSRRGTSVLGQAESTAIPGMDSGRRNAATQMQPASGQSSVPGAGQREAPALFKGGKRDKPDLGPEYGYSRIRFHKGDEINPYADQEDARHGMDARARAILALVVVLVIAFFLSATLPTQLLSPMARSNNSLAAFLRDFGLQAQGLLSFFTGADSMYSTYVWEIVAAGLAGAALGLSGGVYQGAMRNALASPSTLGVTQGGSLGLIIYAVFVSDHNFTGSIAEYNELVAQMSPFEYVMEIFGGFLSSLIACFAIVALIMLIAAVAGRGRVTNVSLIIAGQVFTAVISVVIAWIRYYLTEYLGDSYLSELVANAQTATFMGAYTAVTVAVFAVPVIICMVIVFANGQRLGLLAFGDEQARSMGVSTTFTRNLMVALCTLLTALVVSYVGMIGFVGFMVPHMARRIVGPDFRFLLPASALLGAILVVVVHYIAYLGIPGFSTGATGVFTSIIGCIMFLVMALRSRGNRHAEWF